MKKEWAMYHTTLAIRNSGESSDNKAITLNKLFGKRTVKSFETLHYVYAQQRWRSFPLLKKS